MSQFKQRLQKFGEKANQLRQIVEAAPGKAAEISEAVLLTADQIQQLKHNIQGQANQLRTDHSDRISQAITEIHAHSKTLRKAGYELTGLEIELEPSQRLIVLLHRIEGASESTLRSILALHPTEHALISLIQSLIQAERFADGLELQGMHYDQLRVAIGPSPSLRLSWHSELQHVSLPAPTQSTLPTAATSPGLTSIQGSGPSAFTSSSFFESRTPLPPRATPTETPPHSLPTTTPKPSSSTQESTPSSTSTSSSVLDRFKKMPDLGKRS